MTAAGTWVTEANQALLTDLYQLTMVQAFWREAMKEESVFTLFCRRLPERRNYLLACGLDDVLHYLETGCFARDALEYLRTLPYFSAEFLDWLGEFRFSGDVYAMPEGTPCFAGEPIVEVVAPIAEAQLVETFVMNQLHFQTLAASKASRVVEAARGRPVVDFGLRRMHGADAGLRSARAFHVAGVAATSNVLAASVYGLRPAGTMAHSYIQAHDDELQAFRAFTTLYPETVLLVDTYDTIQGVERVIGLAAELGADFRVRAIRLDSGDLATLAAEARRRLDGAGLQRVEIFASGSLDEYEVDALLRAGAPIDAFGVGTAMGVSKDAPSLDLAYKLAHYGGRGRLKTSPGKPVLPGRKQVYRVEEGGVAVRDVIARWGEDMPGRPLLVQVMRGGRRLGEASDSLDAARERARRELQRLPERVRGLEPAEPAYTVEVSPALEAYHAELIEAVAGARHR